MPDKITDRRHNEWLSHHVKWRWLLDSWEGGDTYRYASYGVDYPYGLPVRNLIRHKREYPERPGEGAYVTGGLPLSPGFVAPTDDDYTLRLVRTPVPTFVAEAVDTHLSRIYAEEVKRESPDARLVEWWSDVDGHGTSIDQWMAETVAPLLMVLGCLDIICDHPPPPRGAAILTRADERNHKLDRCVAGVILPENMLWWELDETGRRYVECLVKEPGDDGADRYRHWTKSDWTLYDDKGEVLGDAPHPFGVVPIRRVFDQKRPRCRNVGLPRYEVIAEYQKEYYNRDSELILSDTTQAHPLLQGPEDFVQADGTVPIGPNWLLPKKKTTTSSTPSYEGFDVVEFPKDGAESIRLNKVDLRDAADRAALLIKPAGAAGTTGNTVAQSGISKRLDQSSGNNLLAKIGGNLGRAELVIAELALTVLYDKPPDDKATAAIVVQYPRSFDLMSAAELATDVDAFQVALAKAGACPGTEGRLLGRFARLMLPGLDDSDYAEIDEEIDKFLDQQSAARAAAMEAAKAVANAPPAAPSPSGEPPNGRTESGDGAAQSPEPGGPAPGA
jgi:hypothetical protein